ncbi:SDR family oxidoreductase [Sphingorhabdus sp. Alg239-R122]|uniref:SDR family oxidoreductase n=1 Tax=Sphingorhabdus sp. Alg239-R122 TaxID=2305989 RepID=UPI0013D934D4|nr:SDR family oxidoreductase [Sphingorhabdus sp. Alg239-R122]
MPKSPPLSRRQILAGTAAVGTAAAIPAIASQSAKKADMSGRSVIITGCSSGFGYLSALHFARAGAKVIATMRNLPRGEADKLRAEADGLDLHIVEIDVLSDESVSEGVAEAERIAGGAIDVLVNNAGIGITGPVEVQDMEATQLIFDTNVYGVQRILRAALPAMRKAKSGQIFNISSQLGRVIVPGAGHYSATKFALEALSEQMAYELVPFGIDVTIIQPGGYPTKVWVNRNRYTAALKERTATNRLEGYGAMAAGMGKEDGSGRSADPMDVPRAMTDIIALPVGKRPLRRAVHPGGKPQLPINKVCAKVQQDWLGRSPYGPLVNAVHD